MNNHGLYPLVEVGVTLETVEESVLAGRQVELEEQRQRHQAEVQDPKRIKSILKFKNKMCILSAIGWQLHDDLPKPSVKLE